MKQIPFYQGISKKVFASGHSIIPGQWYKCVVYSSMNDESTTIIARAKARPFNDCHDDCHDGCHKSMGIVEFRFTKYQTKNLKLGDNNLAVFDIYKENDDTNYSMYKVYEAKVYTSDSIVNHKEFPPLYLDEDGYLVLGEMEGGYIVLNNGETVEKDENTGEYYLKLSVEYELPES